MHPMLAGVRAYPIFLVAGTLVGTTVAILCARRARLAMRPFLAALFVLTIAAPLGAKLYGLIERPGILAPIGTEVFAGYRFPGAVIAVAITLWALGRWGRISAGALADVIAPSFGFSMAIARIGCLLAGCCAGHPSTLPWAIAFPARSQLWWAQVRADLVPRTATATLPVHPLQVYFALLALGLGCLALWLQRHKRYDGQVFLLYMAAYGTGQFLLEFLRFTPLPHVQYMALVVALGAAALLVARGAVPARRGALA
ncbi:prolipoprotein diacylglyceryl transferase [bacterium]|nr:prolipoprotein diacylglyceryl transferase [bacterium]